MRSGLSLPVSEMGMETLAQEGREQLCTHFEDCKKSERASLREALSCP